MGMLWIAWIIANSFHRQGRKGIFLPTCKALALNNSLNSGQKIFEPIAPDYFSTHFLRFLPNLVVCPKCIPKVLISALGFVNLEWKSPFQASWCLLLSVTSGHWGDSLTFPKASDPLAFPFHMLPGASIFSSLGAPHPQPYGPSRTKLLLEWHPLYLLSWMDRECPGGW